MPIQPLNIFSYYNRQRFVQYGSSDLANWYGVAQPDTKLGQALYPAMGRQHVTVDSENELIFSQQPRAIFKTINFMYVVVGTTVFRVTRFFNALDISTPIGGISNTGQVWFSFITVGTNVYALLTDGTNTFLISEVGSSVTMQLVTDPNAPPEPQFVVGFGNRFVVNTQDTPNFYLTQVNLGIPDPLAPTPPVVSAIFTVNGDALVAQASQTIRQMATLHNQLYIFNDFSADIWSNIATRINVAGQVREFPFKLNSSYNWDYGMANPYSLSVDFGRMTWLAKNSNGLVSFMVSSGQPPDDIATQAINVLLEGSEFQNAPPSPFITSAEVNGFLYQYENTIFYRVSAGIYHDYPQVDRFGNGYSLEFNFSTQKWARAIELNGERNRIEKHVYFSDRHLVTVQGDPAMYAMAGTTYFNETRNTAQANPQAPDAFNKYPFRYELVTGQIFEDDYSEFATDWLEIDFVFGNQSFYKSQTPFENAVYIVDETSTDEVPVFLVTEDDEYIIVEGTNTPSFNESYYYALFKPYVALFSSDDGGETWTTADVREFSPLGNYRWRMRWYELGCSRNRAYRLVCVSSAPIVILGGIQNTKRVSGGAY